MKGGRAPAAVIDERNEKRRTTQRRSRLESKRSQEKTKEFYEQKCKKKV